LTRRNQNKAGRVLAATLGVQFFSGVLYVWSIFKDHLIARYGWGDAEATIPYTVSTIVFALSMFTAGLLLDRAGPRVMISAGVILMGGGLILSGFADSVWLWALTFGLITSAGVGFSYLTAAPTVIQWFPPEKRGAITGLAVAGVAISPVMISPLANFALGHFGLKHGSWILGAVALVIPLTLAQLIANPPADYLPANNQKNEDGRTEPNRNAMTWRQMIRTFDFYKLFAMFAFSSSSGLIIFGHMTRIARLQADWDGGYLLLMLIAVFSAGGRFLGGVISDHIGKTNLLRAVFLLQALNMLVFHLMDTSFTLALGVAVAGLCYGATFSAFPLLTADYYGVRNLGANYGLLFIGWGMGGVLGPQIAGSIFDVTGSYHLAYRLALGLLIVAFLISFSLRKEKIIRRTVSGMEGRGGS
jgi:OFA family oxalate/formate antiporter-like MFS transporter